MFRQVANEVLLRKTVGSASKSQALGRAEPLR